MVAHEWQIFYCFFTFCSIFLLIILVVLLFCSIYTLIILVLVFRFSNITIAIFSQKNSYQKKICFVGKKHRYPLLLFLKPTMKLTTNLQALLFWLIITGLHFTCGEKIIEI